MIKKIIKNVLVFIFATFSVVYCYIQVKNIFIDTMKTENAVLYTMDDVLELKCYVVRDESVVKGDKNGIYSYVVFEGEKLASGQTIANVYSSDTEFLIQEQIQEIDKKIDILSDSNVENNYFTIDVDKIDDNVVTLLSNQREQILSGEYSLAIQSKESLVTTLNKRYLVVNALTGFDERIAQLELNKASLTNKSLDVYDTVTADKPGYFFSDIDGFEGKLTIDLIDGADADAIISAIEGEPDKVDKNAVGKIVGDYKWYAVCVVTKAEAQKFSSDKSYDVSFPYSVGRVLNCKLKSKIVQPKTDKTILVFESNSYPDSFNFMRTQTVEVNLGSYSGLRIKKEALRIVDGKEGVYILDGNTVKFKRAKKIYENDGYYIISRTDPEKDGGNTTPYLEMYDAVINNGIDLYDGKTIG